MKHPCNRGQRIKYRHIMNNNIKRRFFRSRYYEPFTEHPTYANLELYRRENFRELSDEEKKDFRNMSGRFENEPFYIQERSNGLTSKRFIKDKSERAIRRKRKSLEDMPQHSGYKKLTDMKRELY